jgi:Protein of unknown function (DUF4239)
MLSYIENVVIVALCVSVVLGLAYYLNRRMEDDVRKRANGVNGWQLSILGSIYAVVLGFMLSDAWLAYQTATDDARNEAAAVLAIYRSSALMPPECAVPLRNTTETYVNTVLNEEWPAMEQHRPGDQASPVVRTLWSIVDRCDSRVTESARESVIHALDTLQAKRNARLEDFTGHLPLILWSLLLFGGAIVTASSCLLANEKQSVHYFHVVSLTMLISVTLLAISDLDRPFDGGTRIAPIAFRNTQTEMNQ